MYATVLNRSTRDIFAMEFEYYSFWNAGKVLRVAAVLYIWGSVHSCRIQHPTPPRNPRPDPATDCARCGGLSPEGGVKQHKRCTIRCAQES